MESETAEKQLRRHADDQAAGEIRIGGEIFEKRQRRGAFEGELDRAFAVELLPHVELQVEERARGADHHGGIAFARVDAAALDRPQAAVVAIGGAHVERAPVPFPAAEQQREQDCGAEHDSAPRLRRHVPLRHRLRHAGTVGGGDARIIAAAQVADLVFGRHIVAAHVHGQNWK